MSHNEAVIYDLEFTTWSGALERNWSEKDEHREIIRIGAISIDLDNLQEIEALDVFVKPSVNPILSDYCAKLTDITDEQIQIEGIELHEALHKFVNFVGKRNIFCHGSDIVVILENLKLNNIAFNARTLQSDCPIVLNEYNQTDSCFESNVVEVILYGSNRSNTFGRMSEGVHVEINLNADCVQLTHADLKPWFYANAPETQGKDSGEIAKTLGVSELNGKIHNPLFDARSILMGLRELILSRHFENPLK
jgi:inhibitor of KinA sporulation pathway (predicted exonuclease)|tara:strand:+ start:90 stop:839 length:750 start_codon:yes stop_codon:yes gene_type:complete